MPQNAPPSVPSTPTPFLCTTTGMSIVPLEPLAQRLEAWLTLPSLSRWLMRTIRLGYAIQFARRPPKFNGVLKTSVAVRNARLVRGDCCPPGKGRNRVGPSSREEAGVLQPLLHRTQETWWPSTISWICEFWTGLYTSSRSRCGCACGCIIKCIQLQDWFAAIDLKDAYFHVSILLRHRPFLGFAFEGRAWQYRVLPFGLSLSPRVFTKVVEGALTLLREVGVRILNYLDDWLILAQSREQLGDPRDLVLRDLSQLGLRVNWEKSKLSPVQRIYFLGVELDSVSMTARLTGRGARAGVPLEQVSRHTVITTDASSTGWGATCNGQAASGLWTGPRLLWHINCLELWAVHLALRQFRPLLLGKHMLDLSGLPPAVVETIIQARAPSTR